MFEHHCILLSHPIDPCKPYTCLVCKYMESQAWKIKRHYLKHTQEKNFSCMFCDYKSAYVNDVKKHTRKHTGEKPFKCQQCPYAASDSKSLATHYKTHLKMPKRTTYFCEVCNLKFYNEPKLVKHRKTHTDYKCEVCEEVFNDLIGFEAHLSDHHIFISDDASIASDKQIKSETPAGIVDDESNIVLVNEIDEMGKPNPISLTIL
uniref:Zinc finger protein 771 n=1 Tax=Cacopsylla melanoneura TaxID=428564 RepID=A0A8D8SGF3_9HEMI